MGAEHWLLLCAPALLLVVGAWAGWAAGRASLDDRVELGDERAAWERAKRAELAAQLQEALRQGPDGARAAAIVLEAERRVSAAGDAAAAGGRRAEFGVLLDQLGPGAEAGGGPAGEAAGKAGPAAGGGGEAGRLGASA